MSAEALTPAKEPLVELDRLGASLDRIDRMLMPITEPILRGIQYGEVQSNVRGQGEERDGVRDYEIGDDPRYIDWNLTARSADGIPKLRQHMKDITPSIYLATDLAQERNRVTPGTDYMEQELALSATLTMLLLAEKEGMPTALSAVNDEKRIFGDTPEMGQQHILEAGKRLVGLVEADQRPEQSSQHLGTLLKRLGQVANESLIVVVSDFRGEDPSDEQHGWKKPLQQLKHQGNDIIAIEPTNLWDFTMEGVERPKFADGKTAWLGYSKQDKAIRQHYEEEVAPAQQQAIDDALKGVEATHVKLDTRDSRWFTSLRRQLQKAAHMSER